MRVADFVIKFLESKKISTVFTVSGGGSIFLCDALYKSKKLKYVSCHHEQAVSFAAESFSRVKNKPGAAIITTGPGGTNCTTGVACCWIDSVPTMFISGQVYLNQTIKNTKLRQIGVQEFDIINMVKSSTKYAVMIKDPTEIKYHLEKAYYTSSDGRPGPVWIDIPADIQNAEINHKNLKTFLPPKKIFKKNLVDKKIKKIAKLLSKCERPVLHLGQGVKISEGEKVLRKIISKYKFPFALTWNASDLVESKNSSYIGRPGAFAERGTNFIIQNCELFISVGSRLPFMVTGYNANDFARNAKVKIMVDIDRFELKKDDMKIDYKICCDAKYFVEKLYFYLKKGKNLTKWIKYCNDLKERYPIVQNKFFNLKKYVNSYVFVDTLCKHLKENKTIITDMGFSFTTTHQAFKNKENQILLTNSGHAPMGWGLPAAIGAACMGKNFREVICLTGEGGFQMNIQELATMMHNKIPIKIFIFNNGGYLTIKQTQQLGFKGRLMGSTKSSGLSFPDYRKIANSHKLNYHLIKNQDNINNKIDKILKIKKPLICEILMDPNEEQIPKAINKKNSDGKSIPTVFEDMYPFLGRLEFKKNLY